MMLAYSIEDKDLRRDFKKYFDLKIRHWEWDYSKSKYRFEKEEFGKHCTKNHFKIDDHL